jgi:magnesium transporter
MIRDKIDRFHFEDIRNELHPSAFFSHELYDMIIVRLPFFNTDKEIEYISKAFIITDENYYYYDKELKEFQDVGGIKGFYKILDNSVDKTMAIVNDYFAIIEKMEDKIYDGKGLKEFNKQWFINKNDLIRINRVVGKTAEVFQLIIRAYKKEDDYLEHHFEDINEHLNRAARNSAHLLEKLDSIYSFNLNQTNEQMNRIVYILTLLSGIFLPLNLIVGFFGMNTTSLPFTQESGGTINVILLLILSALLATAITFFMKRK